ncbi:MAG: hypothetical protein GEU79_06280 [Acidimicrobiia bacterium]|nr:hypothetical protein [Acidimicrobiia bacterium]
MTDRQLSDVVGLYDLAHLHALVEMIERLVELVQASFRVMRVSMGRCPARYRSRSRGTSRLGADDPI